MRRFAPQKRFIWVNGFIDFDFESLAGKRGFSAKNLCFINNVFMNISRVYCAIVLLVCAGVLISCKDAHKEEPAKVPTGTPYVKLDEQIERDSITISPKLARSVACEELRNNAILQCFDEEVVLSENCRVVYGYDSRPKYYEWDVLRGDSVVAMVTTFAQEEEDCAVAFIFEYPYVREKKEGLEMFEGFYPTVFWGVPGEEFGAAPKVLYAEDGKRIITEIPSVNEDERYDKLLEQMDDYSRSEAVKMLNINRENRINGKERAKSFWEMRRGNSSLQGNASIKISGNDITSGHPNT